MVSKNNNIREINSNLKKHYKSYKVGKNWAYAGIGSIAVAAGLIIGGSTVAHADSTTATDQSPVLNDNAASSTVTSQSASSVTLPAGSSSASENSSASIESAPNSVATTANSDQPVSDSGLSAQSASSTGTVSNSSSTSETQVISSSQAASFSAGSQTLVNPTSDELNTAKSSAAQAYVATGQAQEVNAVAADTTSPIDVTPKIEDQYGNQIDSVGYGKGIAGYFQLVFTISNPQAGDTISITVPTSTSVYTVGQSNVEQITTGGKTTFVTNSDGTMTITDTFSSGASSSYTQAIKFQVNNNYKAQPKPMTDVGTTTQTISYSVNNAQQNLVTFTQIVTPNITQLGNITAAYPNSSTTTILPDTDYVYSFSVNEADGVFDGSYTSDKINSAANYGGTTITIPVPEGFVLNEPETLSLSALTDGTTVTQPGGKGSDIIIFAGKGLGEQNYNTMPYYLVGSFDVTQTATDQTLTADGERSFSQIVDSAGNTLKTQGILPWTVTIQGTNDSDKAATATVTISSVPGSNNSLVLDDNANDVPAYLARLGFSTNSNTTSTDTHIVISVPDGMTATQLQVPTAGASSDPTANTMYYLPGTTSYSYTLSYADGSTPYSGNINSGGIITFYPGKVVRTIDLVPNYLAAGATTGNGDYFTLLGSLSSSYDSGKSVAVGDQLTMNMTISSSDLVTATQSVTYTVSQAISNVYSYSLSMSSTPGTDNAAYLMMSSTGVNSHTTAYIYEPIFYYVIPTSMTVSSFMKCGDAATSVFTADDGRSVAKIDYTGTNEYVNVENSGINEIALAINADALPGSYDYEMYVYSPVTELINSTLVDNTSYTEGHADAVLMSDIRPGYATNLPVDAAGTYSMYSFAQGNQDAEAVASGTSNISGNNVQTFYTSINNTSSDKTGTATMVINLPTVGDDQGSQYNFDLTGPVTIPDNYTTSSGGTGDEISATVYYSTSLKTMTSGEAAPSTDGYVTADQVTDWSSIRSIMIVFTNMENNASTGRIAINGTADDFANDAGKTGYLETGFSIGDGTLSVSNKSSTVPAAQISIIGTSTIKARFHYQINGVDKYIYLDDLSQTLNDGVDSLLESFYPTSKEGLSSTDLALIPDGYDFQNDTLSPTLIDTDGKIVTDQFGETVTPSLDGDYIQYELVGKSSISISYVDDDDDERQVGDTVNYSGAPGYTGNYQIAVPDNYELVSVYNGESEMTVNDGDTVNYVLPSENDDAENLVIHLKHTHTIDSETTTDTVSYTGLPTKNVQPDNVYTLIWTTDTDNVTKEKTYTPSVSSESVSTPIVAGYTTSDPVVTFSHTEQTDQPTDQIQTVIYLASSQTAVINYVDDDNNENIVASNQIAGVTDGSEDWTTNNLPSGYQLASGQPAIGTYTFTANSDQTISVHVTHIHTSGALTTINTVNYTGLPDAKAIADSTVSVNWTTDTDEANNTTTYTPTAINSTITATNVAGYTPSESSITFTQAASTSKPSGQSKTVTYTANPQTVAVEYLDDNDNGMILSTNKILNGTTDGITAWDTLNLPGTYALAAGQAANGTYVFTADSNQVIQIHVVHQHKSGTVTSTDTVSYTGLPADVAASPVKVDIDWTTDTDEATSNVTYTPTDSATRVINSPVIAGYTPNHETVSFTPVATTTLPGDLSSVVNYTANAQTVTVEYVDNDNNEAIVGNSVTINGKTGDTVNWDTVNLPDGYQLAAGQLDGGTYMFTADANQAVQVHVTHIVTSGSITTTNTITYLGLPTSDAQPNSVTSVDWTTSTDQATGTITYQPSIQTNSIVSPVIAGYTADTPTVTFSQETTTKEPENQNVSVTYEADPQTATVEYVDDDNDGNVLGIYATISGHTDSSAAWNTDNLLPVYSLATGQASSGSYTFTGAANQVVEVHVKHVHAYGNSITTDTVNYTGLPADRSQTAQHEEVNWDTDTDEATGIIIYTPKNKETEITIPVVDGYTADSNSDTDATVFNQQVVTVDPTDAQVTTPTDQTKTVNYSANVQIASVVYVDDDNNGRVVSLIQTITGGTDSTVNWNAIDVPFGYQLNPNQATSGAYTFTADAIQTVEVHLTEIHKTGNFTSVDEVVYTGLSADMPQAITITVDWQANTNEVTGITSYTPLTNTSTIVSPEVAGYSPSISSVTFSHEYSDSTAPTDRIVNVSYVADTQIVTIEYIDDSEDGAVLGEIQQITSTTGSTESWNTENLPDTYIIVSGQNFNNYEYTFTADSNQTIQVHVIHNYSVYKYQTTNTINYAGLPADNVKPDQTSTVDWNEVTDQVTGEVTYLCLSPSVVYTVPIVDGYTPDQQLVTFPEATVKTDPNDPTIVPPANQTITVTYSPNAQQATVEYVDDDNVDSNGYPQVLGTTATITGVTDSTVDWSTDHLPYGYQLTTGQASSGSYTFTANDDQVIQVHVSHVHKQTSLVTKNTIHYEGLPTSQPDYSMNIAWSIDTDVATGTVTYAPMVLNTTVVSPVIPGYTPDQSTVTFSEVLLMPSDQAVTVSYTANPQIASIEYIDDDSNDTILMPITTISGYTNGKADWNTDNLPNGYQLAKGQDANGTYLFTADANQTVQVHVDHIHVTGTANSTDSVSYTGLPKDSTLNDQKATVNWTTDTDQVTGVTTYTPVDTVTTISSPTVAGYEPEQSEVNFNQEVQTDVPEDKTATVSYKAIPETLTILYIDDVTGKTVKTFEIHGIINDKGTYNVDLSNLNSGYRLAGGQDNTIQYKMSPDITNVDINLSHHITDSTITGTRTIDYVILEKDGNPASDQSKAPTDNVDTITWKVVTDDVDGSSYATANATSYAAVDSPIVLGYTADQQVVNAYPAPTTAAEAKNIVMTVNYIPDTTTLNVSYVDDVTGKIVKTVPVEVVTDETGAYKTNLSGLNTGYQLAKDQTSAVNYAIEPDTTNDLTVHLSHIIKTGTYQTTRTIRYVIADGDQSKTPAPVTQTINWITTTDEVTGVSSAVAKNSYGKVDTPQIPGYTANESSIADVNEGDKPTDELGDTSDTVTYTADLQTVTISYVNSRTDAIVKTVTVTGRTDSQFMVANLPGYVLNSKNLPTLFEPGMKTISVLVSPINDETSGNDRSITKTNDNGGTSGATNVSLNTARTAKITENSVSSDVNGDSQTASRLNMDSQNENNGETQLPQTGEAKNQTIGLSILGFATGMFGLVGLKRKKRNED
ncbi:KxYKxGKxW signal peptide domain-containing protein [Paucilactobacillus suebicus]|uniref:Adhesion exoprotein n=1 Tax=Paucilactobacillus suebicus DSM 5007 = KCTC 3549 TaxID=1423807 RepID=A0A0R1WA23_9LACO|nr:KxYKxGKxW signal peptide domain-containing protein [Paucilactobacillus suebicus]KRM12345.1 adhesion exoprotein [Paucilactobacillus suebicus DSM 5007 = KCTC 3549]